MSRFDELEHGSSHEHNHDCGHGDDCGHNHEEATLEGTIAHLVLSFSQLAFSQTDTEVLADDAEKQQLSFQFLYGAVTAFAEAENLSQAQVRQITADVFFTLLSWDREDCIACAQDLMSLEDATGDLPAIEQGKSAMQEAMQAGQRLNEILENQRP